MNSIKWIKFVLASTLMCLSFSLLFNYLINPYHVFSHHYLKNFNQVKDNLVDDEMSKFYAAKDANPDIILVGSSRIEHIHPKYVEKYTNGKVYNLGVKGSGLSSQYKLIQYFVTKKNVKTVLLGLDFYAFSPANIGNYENINSTRYDNYFLDDYLKSLLGFRTLRKSASTLKDNLKHKQPRILWESGWDTYSHEYHDIETHDDEWYLKKVDSAFPDFGVDTHFFGNEDFKTPHSIDKGLKVLDAIITVCEKNGVELKLFTTPIYYKIYDVIQQRGYGKTYEYWKQSLQKYNKVYDFNYKNSITSDFRNYVEASHFKSVLGELIFAKLYNNKELIINDFGYLMTEDKKDIN